MTRSASRRPTEPAAVVRFLSAGWVAALDEALRAAGIAADDRPPLVIQQIVQRPDGTTTAYHVRIDAGGAEARTGPAADATVSFRQSLEVARGIATGERDAHVEFLRHQVSLSGDATALLHHGPTLEQLTGALSGLRAVTDFGDPGDDDTADDPGIGL